MIYHSYTPGPPCVECGKGALNYLHFGPKPAGAFPVKKSRETWELTNTIKGSKAW